MLQSLEFIAVMWPRRGVENLGAGQVPSNSLLFLSTGTARAGSERMTSCTAFIVLAVEDGDIEDN